MDADIRTLTAPGDLADVNALFQQVWGTPEAVVHVDLLRAVAHAGGYVAGAYDETHLVGASFGFLADYRGERALHSHITGILPGVQHSGLGRALKEHQREWAASRGIGWITWTFDPLVRRNAWFNIEVLGAEVAEYVDDFYGPMNDSLNAGAPSDRLVVAWPTASRKVPSTSSHEVPSTSSHEVPGTLRDAGGRVGTPEDIVVLRRTDPAAAGEWRLRLRRELGGPIAAGARVVGFTREGEYVLEEPG